MKVHEWRAWESPPYFRKETENEQMGVRRQPVEQTRLKKEFCKLAEGWV